MLISPTALGDTQANNIVANAGGDTLIGYGGNDTITGGAGDDRLSGDSPFPQDTAGILALIANRPAYTNWAFNYAFQSDTRALVAAPQDMLVIGAASNSDSGKLAQEVLWTRPQIAEILGSGKQLYGYLDIAKINTFSRMWDPGWTANGTTNPTRSPSAPVWLGAVDTIFSPSTTFLVDFVAPNTPGDTSRTLNAAWKQVVLNRVDFFVDRGYTGLFLDDLGQYFTYGVTSGMSEPQRLATVAANARAIRDLVIAIHDYAPGLKLIVNGSPFLLSDGLVDGATGQEAANAAFIRAISAMVAENYLSGNSTVAIDRAVSFSADNAIPILSVDTALLPATTLTAAQRLLYITEALSNGFLPSVQDNYFTPGPSFLATLAAANLGPHNDVLDGGGGSNTATYSGNRADYTVSATRITDNRSGSPDGTDTLANIQTLAFRDGSYLLALLITPTTLSIAATDARKPEGNSGTTPFSFTVTRSGDPSTTVSATYSVTGSGSHPAAGADFASGVLPTGTITFLPGETVKTLAISVAGDTAVEPDEAFNVTLTSATAITTASASGAIQADDSIADLIMLDGRTGLRLPTAPSFYAGPVAGLERQFITASTSDLTVAVAGPNWFIHTGSGTDAIAVAGGTNVLDGGTGSNFLSGAAGFDTFFVDARNASADIWSTVASFGAGDSATLWGVAASSHALTWTDDEGATGYHGLTLHARSGGGVTASLTLASYTTVDRTNGRLAISFGRDTASSSDYLYIHANF